MRLRARHLACLLLLLSSLGAAEEIMRAAEAANRAGDYTVGGHYISVLLHQAAASLPRETPLSRSLDAAPESGPAASPAPLRVVWTMRPPAAHTASVHALTSLRS